MIAEPRVAHCSRCKGRPEPSSENLAFFEDRSPGSRFTEGTCGICRFAPVAHVMAPHWKLDRIEPHAFVPHPGMDTDIYYCGCGGWD